MYVISWRLVLSIRAGCSHEIIHSSYRIFTSSRSAYMKYFQELLQKTVDSTKPWEIGLFYWSRQCCMQWQASTSMPTYITSMATRVQQRVQQSVSWHWGHTRSWRTHPRHQLFIFDCLSRLETLLTIGTQVSCNEKGFSNNAVRQRLEKPRYRVKYMPTKAC